MKSMTFGILAVNETGSQPLTSHYFHIATTARRMDPARMSSPLDDAFGKCGRSYAASEFLFPKQGGIGNCIHGAIWMLA